MAVKSHIRHLNACLFYAIACGQEQFSPEIICNVQRSRHELMWKLGT